MSPLDGDFRMPAPLIHVSVPDHVENEPAYVAAAQSAIRANAAKGKRARWLAADPTREALIKFLDQAGMRSGFAAKLLDSYSEWGTLTEGQEAAARRMMDEAATRRASADARDALSRHLGAVGDRITVTAAVVFVAAYETQFGTMFVNGLRAGDDVLIYKGSKSLAAKGSTVTVKATVKEHGERNGTKQTLLARPVVLDVAVPA
jgi:hypothetical protein